MLKVAALALADHLGVFIIGILESEESLSGPVKMSHCVRMYELSDPADPRRVGLSWHPDPFMTTDQVCTFNMEKILCSRLLTEEEDMAVKYRAFLTDFRLKRSGLVSGSQAYADSQRKILSEGV